MNRNYLLLFAALPLVSCSSVTPPPAHTGVDPTGRYIQCRDGEIQLLPALAKSEIPDGEVKGVEAVGGFSFDIQWHENKMSEMYVHSASGGVCRVRSSAGIYSPLLRQAKHDCKNPAIRATKEAPAVEGVPDSIFLNPKRYSSVVFDFDTEPGETLHFYGVRGNQDWTGRADHFTDDFLKTPEAARIADNVLAYQLVTGGWPKNVPMDNPLTAREKALLIAHKGDIIKGTIDNGATMTEIRFLARMYKATGKKEYLEGFEHGLEFLFYMQYPNGGWAQCDPKKGGYWSQITFNDGAMIGVMELLRRVYEAKSPYDFPISDGLKAKCRAAFDRGVKCILACQVEQDGKKTVWCQQHDKVSLKPCIGRAFELPCLCTQESVGIVELLMSLPRTPEIDAAIEGACAWWPKVAVYGYAVERGWRRPSDGMKVNRLVEVDPKTNPPLWARYYTLEDNRPFTGTRQSTMKFTFEEQLEGDNMSYQWWNQSGEKIARDYDNWVHAEEQARAKADKLAESVVKHAKGAARKMLASEIARIPDPVKIDGNVKPKWNYTHGLLLEAMMACGDVWPEMKKQVRPYVKSFLDQMIRPDGTIVGYSAESKKLDCVKPGMMVFDAEAYFPKEKPRLDKAIAEMMRQLRELQPRTKEGGFWHKDVYPHQMWLDGLYMEAPFYARYAARSPMRTSGPTTSVPRGDTSVGPGTTSVSRGDTSVGPVVPNGPSSEEMFHDVVNQFRVCAKHTHDPKTGLFRHGWDEARAQSWADKTTGQSQHAWGRAQGWFLAAMVDVLDYLPEDGGPLGDRPLPPTKGLVDGGPLGDRPLPSTGGLVGSDHRADRAWLLKLFNGYCHNLIKYQSDRGAWYQVADVPHRAGNYEEATATALIAYAMLKGWNKGYVDRAVRDAGVRALDCLMRDFVRENPDGTVSLVKCCGVAGLGPKRPGTFEYYLSEPIRDNDAKGTGPYLMALCEAGKLREAE